MCELDEPCQIFLDRCLPECTQKLLGSGAVRRWSPEIQEGVFVMLDLLTDLVIARLEKGSIPDMLLRHYAVVNMIWLHFNEEHIFNIENR